MKRKNKKWFWNVVLGLSVLLSLLAFMLHYHNWTRLEPDRMQIISGFYYKELPYKDITAVEWSQKLPQMEREHGFSAGSREKGVFKDSLYPDRKVYVYVDDLRQRKIKLTYSDSMYIYMNFTDSLETVSMYHLLREKIKVGEN
ncbi:hypothetical protein [Robiginitalea sp. IMCC43444]|uniref:hypothetical protein n=1 Tax=Robiginitalea sp. IMCC43444 TaxID=3459121 RepID=UPI004042F1B8